jgi:hypothetical protein
MAWFSKLTGGKEKEEKPQEKAEVAKPDAPQREFERFAGAGERVTMLQDGRAFGGSYEVRDLSLGGFAIGGYDGNLRGNQYFEFRFSCVKDGKPAEIDGFANVVRVKDGMLAAKYPPQPRLRAFVRDYLETR